MSKVFGRSCAGSVGFCFMAAYNFHLFWASAFRIQNWVVRGVSLGLRIIGFRGWANARPAAIFDSRLGHGSLQLMHLCKSPAHSNAKSPCANSIFARLACAVFGCAWLASKTFIRVAAAKV